VSDGRPAVVLALTPLAERAIEPLLFGERAAVTPVHSVAEADELARCAQESAARAVLISPGLAGLTPGHCERLRAAGLRLIGVALDEHERRSLQALSLEAIVAHDAPAEALLAQLHEQPEATRTQPTPAPVQHGSDAGEGTVVALVGCKGAPGSSECAASLAALAARRWPALLLELDMLGGGLDVRIGADPQHGSLLGLARAAAAGEASAELLERWVTSHAGWPPVLLAPPDPDAALSELAHPGTIAGALEGLRAMVPVTVCDVGFLIAGGEEVCAQARAHREALVSADAVLLVLGARDSQQRAGFAQLQLLLGALGISPQRLRIVVNGIGAPGAASQRALSDTLMPRLAEHGLAPDAWLPWDRGALQRAHRRGQPLAAALPRSGYARALARLLDELFLPQGTPRARKQRLVPPLPLQGAREREEVALPWRR
jgi:Flp pilus assembly CpaE family ATPase